jgi:hypothetical protein
MSYLSHITRVLAAIQATNLCPVHERRIRQGVISEYFKGDGSSFSDGEFLRALCDVECRRFVKVRDSYTCWLMSTTKRTILIRMNNGSTTKVLEDVRGRLCGSITTVSSVFTMIERSKHSSVSVIFVKVQCLI